MTPLTPWNWPNCSSPTCSQNMARHPMSPLTGVGGITVQYPARLYSPVLVPTVIPQFSLMAQCFFDLEIRRKSCLLAALIYSHPIFHFPKPFQTLTQLCH